MITERTVFIIGAGGSKPYGFPTGEDLRESICTNYLNNYNQLLHDNSGPVLNRDSELNIAKNFTTAFYHSSNKSIDLFLSRNLDYSNTGKRSIIIEILNAERKFINEGMKFSENDWYAYLFHRMTDSFIKKEDYGKFKDNNITFITFNYDRTLENFLANSLINSFLQTPGDILEQMKDIPIYHIYGQIGFLPWQTGKPVIHFGQKCSLGVIDTIQSNIRIIYDFEKGFDDQIISKIKEAEIIYFLGFGYAAENLKLLRIPEVLSKGQKVFGTAMGFFNEEIMRTKFKLNGKWVNNFDKDMILEDCDCLTLLRKYL